MKPERIEKLQRETREAAVRNLQKELNITARQARNSLPKKYR